MIQQDSDEADEFARIMDDRVSTMGGLIGSSNQFQIAFQGDLRFRGRGNFSWRPTLNTIGVDAALAADIATLFQGRLSGDFMLSAYFRITLFSASCPRLSNLVRARVEAEVVEIGRAEAAVRANATLSSNTYQTMLDRLNGMYNLYQAMLEGGTRQLAGSVDALSIGAFTFNQRLAVIQFTGTVTRGSLQFGSTVDVEDPRRLLNDLIQSLR